MAQSLGYIAFELERLTAVYAPAPQIEALHELRPHETAVDPSYYDYVTVEWAKKWPAEEIWVARKA